MYPTPEHIAAMIAQLPAYTQVTIRTTYTPSYVNGQTRDLPVEGRRITTDQGFEFFATVKNLTRIEAIGLTVHTFDL